MNKNNLSIIKTILLENYKIVLDNSTNDDVIVLACYSPIINYENNIFYSLEEMKFSPLYSKNKIQIFSKDELCEIYFCDNVTCAMFISNKFDCF